MYIKGKEFVKNGVGVKQYSLFEDPNPDHRPQMEDTSFVLDNFLSNCPKSTLFGVFDGHGGKDISFKLPTMLPNMIKSNIKSCKGNIKMAIEKSFLEADSNLAEVLVKTESGSTGTVGLVTIEESKRLLYLAHVGDSSAYLFEDHQFQLLTKEHRASNQDERVRVEKTGGKILNNRLCGVLAVTRAFGDYALKKNGLTAQPEVKKIEIRLSHKYIIVGSDGLWDFVEPAVVQKVVRDEVESDEIGKRLIKLALEKGSNDNITVIVIKL